MESCSRWKTLLATLTLLIFALLMIACGGGSSSSSSSNTGGSTPTPGSSNTGSGGSSQSTAAFAYIANNGTKQVQGFKLGTDNSLSQVPGSPYANAFTSDIALVSNTLVASTDAGVKTWTIDSSTGSLTAGSTTAAGGTFAVFGNFLYAAAGPNVIAYSVNNGTLTQISSVSVASLCQDCQSVYVQVSADGRYVYATTDGFHDVNGFAVLDRSSSGAVSNPRVLQAVNGSTSGDIVVISNDNRYAYEINAASQVMVWQIDPATGTTTLVNANAMTLSGSPSAAKITPDGKYLVVINPGPNRIDVLALNGATVTPVSGSPFATGTNPGRLAISSNGQYLFVDCRGDGSADLFAYSIGSGGALTQVAHQSLGGDPGPIAVK